MGERGVSSTVVGAVFSSVILIGWYDGRKILRFVLEEGVCAVGMVFERAVQYVVKLFQVGGATNMDSPFVLAFAGN